MSLRAPLAAKKSSIKSNCNKITNYMFMHWAFLVEYPVYTAYVSWFHVYSLNIIINFKIQLICIIMQTIVKDTVPFHLQEVSPPLHWSQGPMHQLTVNRENIVIQRECNLCKLLISLFHVLHFVTPGSPIVKQNFTHVISYSVTH